MPEMLGVEKSSHPLLCPCGDVHTGLTLCLHLPGRYIRIALGGSHHQLCWFRESRQPRSECPLMLAHEAVERVCPSLSPLTSGALLAMVVVSGLGDLCLPLHPSFSVCLSVSKCVLCMGAAVLLEEDPILISSPDCHQLCEDLSFVFKVTQRYLGLRPQHLDLET